MRASLIAIVVITVGLTLGIAYGLLRVGSLEDHEVNAIQRTTLAEAEPLSASRGPGVTLARAELERDHAVEFEVCAGEPMTPERWEGALSLRVVRQAGEVMTESPMSAEVLSHVRRNDAAGCLTLGSGVLEHTGEYEVEARWDAPPAALMDVPIVVRMVGRHPLAASDLGQVVATWALAFALLVALAVWRRLGVLDPAPVSDAEWDEAAEAASPLRKLAEVPDWARGIAGVVLLGLVFFGLGYVQVGAAGGAALMVGIAILEVVVAIVLIGGPSIAERFERLALARPTYWYAAFPVAVASGLALYFLATWSTHLVPSTGVSSVQRLVSWPSGMLSFAVPAVIVPIAEEWFFRGFIYGAFEKRSRVLAFVLAWGLFVLAHVPQTFGQWGALVAIAVASLGFTMLRAFSGSTLVSAMAHVVYNGVLAIGAIL
ncbi:MAG: lysostaphin resistance A-like protein [Sandaracinaceae bacterium]